MHPEEHVVEIESPVSLVPVEAAEQEPEPESEVEPLKEEEETVLHPEPPALEREARPGMLPVLLFSEPL